MSGSNSGAEFSLGTVYADYVGSTAGYRIFRTDGGWIANELAVCPVVSLKSEITVEEVVKKEGVEEAVWNTEREDIIALGELKGEEGKVKSN